MKLRWPMDRNANSAYHRAHLVIHSPDRGCVRRTSRSTLECHPAVNFSLNADHCAVAAAGAPHTVRGPFPAVVGGSDQMVPPIAELKILVLRMLRNEQRIVCV